MTTDELRAKFEAYRKLLEARGFRWSEMEWNSRFDTWQSANASRDTEVEALKKCVGNVVRHRRTDGKWASVILGRINCECLLQ